MQKVSELLSWVWARDTQEDNTENRSPAVTARGVSVLQGRVSDVYAVYAFLRSSLSFISATFVVQLTLDCSIEIVTIVR